MVLLQTPPSTTLSDISISETDVFNEIGPKILKSCPLALHEPLFHLLSLTHYLPAQWRMHLITPIHKSGDKTTVKKLPTNFLTFVLSKVLEHIVYDKIIEWSCAYVGQPLIIAASRNHPLLDTVTALLPWLISSSSLHPTPFLLCDHACTLLGMLSVAKVIGLFRARIRLSICIRGILDSMVYWSFEVASGIVV